MKKDGSPSSDFRDLLGAIKADPHYEDQIVHVEEMRPRRARYGSLSGPLPEELQGALLKVGIRRLYSHQAEAIGHARAGRDVVIVTGTASGKTLCYNIPVLEALLAEPVGRALYLFPTKALAQDQLRTLLDLAEKGVRLKAALLPGTYDGDTPSHQRKRTRETRNVILTNPDMLHQGILPNHGRWAEFFSNLRYVIVDEIHQYRGIFGSNVANVLRRLNRVCAHYGASPLYIVSSATIANPVEHAETLTGRPMQVVSKDGSPSGCKYFVLWNPPPSDRAWFLRRSANVEAERLLTRLVKEGVKTIVFTRARVVAELIYRYARDSLAKEAPKLAGLIRAYRAGYLPEDRRRIEGELFSGKLLAVTSTTALELGIDVGALDACVLVGFPGTIASTWQQAGRAGRSSSESLAVLIAYSDPVDQYLMRHPEYFFGRSPEQAVVDPQNKYVLASHVACAAYELPLGPEDAAYFGELTQPIAEILEEGAYFSKIGGKWYWATTGHPASSTNLRTISSDTCAIQAKAHGSSKVLGVVDSISAPELVYPEAVYLHEGETYLVRRLDLEGKTAYVEQAEVDYYTQPVLSSSIQVGEIRSEKSLGGSKAFYGGVRVTWATTGFVRYRFYTGENIGGGKLDLPPQTLDTMAMWLNVDEAILQDVAGQGLNPAEGLVGIRNMVLAVLPSICMCDRRDLGGIVDSRAIGVPAVFVYDRYLGGLGFSERGFETLDRMLKLCLEMAVQCECRDGCLSCMGASGMGAPGGQEPELGGRSIPDKKASLAILSRLVR